MLLMAACHGHPATTATPVADAGIVASTTLDKVWILGASAPAVADTSVGFARAVGRTIVLRHAAPDNAIFAIITFPATRDSMVTSDSIRVSIHPTPGEYSLEIASDDKFPAGTQCEFSYAIHFQTPPDATAKYPNPARLGDRLSPAQLQPANVVSVLASDRPAADVLRFAMRGPGTYAIVFTR